MSKVNQINQSQFAHEVLHSDIPVVVDFYATWCPPCKMLSPILDSLAEKFAGRIKFVKVNSDEEPGLAGKYQIHALPTIMLFDNGEVAGRVEGLPQEAAFREGLNQWLNGQKAESR